MGTQWIVARTKPCRELYAAENVARQGFEFYLPKVYDRIRTKRGHLAVARALFPTCLFVRTDGPWRYLLSTFGVTGVLLVGEAPGTISDKIIADIRAREGTDGIVTLPKLFEIGDEVEVTRGHLAHKCGIFDGVGPQDRLWVLFDFLGRKTRVLIARDALVELV